ncbi:MAG: phage holin family protein, partial [Candidatus Paracaedibacteraceae bacterium]|nr:phage holin family protein [Candidatus Paracaedibacteraceae bacterium]
LNELISIVENAGLMGMYVPPVIRKAIEVLEQQSSIVGKSK